MVRMEDLRKFLRDLDLDEGETLLQSGNMVFTDAARSTGELEQLLQDEAKKRLGLETEFFVRSAKQWEQLIAANPFPQEAKEDPSRMVVTFLKREPTKQEVDEVQAAISGPERISAVGKELYVVYPLGMGVSTIARTPGWKQLAGNGTARNWNTVLRLATLVRS
jgi:uncharacterized protein (DUF1697 family)